MTDLIVALRAELKREIDSDRVDMLSAQLRGVMNGWSRGERLVSLCAVMSELLVADEDGLGREDGLALVVSLVRDMFDCGERRH